MEQSSSKKYIIIGIACIIAIPIWLWIALPTFTNISSDFSYKANLISLDNFYDEAKGEFLGEKRSVTTFTYEVVAEEKGTLKIQNSFDARTVEGEKIFSVERIHNVEAGTRRHVKHEGNLDKHDYGGYIFAPRHLKKEESFAYWHYISNMPVAMVFAGEENILGLPVYRYEANYEGVKVDLTANLGFLPEVGKTRGITLEPYVKLWIEPVTGYLVRFEDGSHDYYFHDLKTGEKQNSYNNFVNKYTKKSIEEHVIIAKSEKFKFILVETVIPLLLALIALALFVGVSRKKIAWIVLILGVTALGVYLASRVYTPGTPEMIKIGIARWVNSPSFIKNEEEFKKALALAGYKEGENIRYIVPEAVGADKVLHRIVIENFVKENVDLIYSQSTPGTIIAKSVTDTIPIVFSIVLYPVETGIVKSVQNSGNNLVGSRTWVSPAEQIALMLELVPGMRSLGFVHRKDEPNSTVQLQEFTKIATPLGVTVVPIQPKILAEILPAMQEVRGQIGALYTSCDTLMNDPLGEGKVITYGKEENIPVFSCAESGIRTGSLAGVVADFSEIGKLAGEKAALILEGATPQSLETSSVARPFIYINKTTADRLGITIPQGLSARAREIIK